MRELPFRISHKADGSAAARGAANFTCVRCHCSADLPLVRQRSAFNPEATVKRAEAAGWRVNGARAECPSCLARGGERKRGDSPAPKPVPQKQPTARVIPMAEAKPATRGETLREASPQERVKIRAVLDRHFDDGAGCWLDGYSDQKAGEEVGVPWAIVTRIREAAYGPIRVDPEVAGIRAEIVQVARDLVALNDRHAALAKRLEALAAKRAA